MLQLDDFLYYKPTNTCCMDLIFQNLLSTLISTYSNASYYHILQYQGPIVGCSAHPNKLIVRLLVPDRAIKGKSQKRLKDNQG